MTYTVKELAEKMGVTQHTVRYYTDQGLLHHVGLPWGVDTGQRGAEEVNQISNNKAEEH